MTGSTAQTPRQMPLQGKILLGVILGAGFMLVRSCVDATQASRALKASDDATAFTIEAAELQRCESILNEAKKGGCVSHIVLSADKQIAELHVLPAFIALHPDTKSKFFRAAYHSAFGLPLSTERFSRLMYVMDSSGKQIQTLDLALRGTEFE
jgi:hypothetical protein